MDCGRAAKIDIPTTHTHNTKPTNQPTPQNKQTNPTNKHTKQQQTNSVKRAVASTTSFGGLPTCLDYHLTKREEEDVVDAGFLHERFTPHRGGRVAAGAAGASDALVVATGHKVFSLAGADDD